MPIKTSKLFLSSAQRTSGAPNSANFSNIKWESLIPTGVRKIRVRAKFWTPPCVLSDSPVQSRELLVVTARFPGSIPTYDAHGSYADTPLFAAQRSSNEAAMIGVAGTTTYTFDSKDSYVHELNARPHGEINISTFVHSIRVVGPPAVAGGTLIPSTMEDVETGAATGPRWYMILTFDCEMPPASTPCNEYLTS
jgi:hypothetical protein